MHNAMCATSYVFSQSAVVHDISQEYTKKRESTLFDI